MNARWLLRETALDSHGVLQGLREMLLDLAGALWGLLEMRLDSVLRWSDLKEMAAGFEGALRTWTKMVTVFVGLR